MKKLLTLFMSVLLLANVVGCAKTEPAKPESSSAEAVVEESKEEVKEETVTVKEGQRAGVTYVTVAAPETSRENGVISAEEWKDSFPEIYASYMANGENKEAVQYLETSPYLIEIYEGYGFAKDYKSARGHEYTLTDVAETLRPHALANCLTCKTADYTALVNKMGTNAYSLSFDEVYSQVSENVGCYTCHENEVGNEGALVLTHDYFAEIGDQLAADGVALDISTCGQCHTEYFFDGNDNKASSVPYTGIADMGPDAELAHYNEVGFSDWTQESTGTAMLKVQHPEIETYLGSIHDRMGLSCADCHMASETAEDGSVYVSHTLVSPLNSTVLLESCAVCHKDTDMAAKVHAIQDEIVAREDVVGAELVELKKALVEAIASGNYSEDELNAIRAIYRDAVWYFDYDYVENSEGVHNSTLARTCLDKSEALIAEAMALFK